MRQKSSSRRQLVTTAVAAGLFWLSVVSPGAAAPLESAAASDAQPARTRPFAFKLKKLVHQSRLVRGPVAKRFRLALFDLQHRTQKVGHAARSGARDDDQAIQNDTPATEITIAPLSEPQPLGFFVETFHQAAFTVAFSPRAPRGPPTHI